ncbi:uncharacterized protein C8R40DRAFT_1093534 [Lentinula edodes]|uniref:uncharacterized protein n=1 Tax=Lentinula edodes TaxID=5353 RepID=UPI001E8D98AE|nr:uncharacterized protein C8R40DRAFT_1093534 [Lentinula edodes]KAH7878030.1 hypothetical protein C8R40DRAFT_1093534 [Lentinula edodes]
MLHSRNLVMIGLHSISMAEMVGWDFLHASNGGDRVLIQKVIRNDGMNMNLLPIW